MTAFGRIEPAPEAASSAAPLHGCLHCGSACAGDFCCNGCAAAHGLVKGLGLDAFYRRSTAAIGALRPDDAPPVALAPHAQAQADGTFRLDLMLAGLSCGACVWLVEQALAAEPDILGARASLTSRRLTLSWRGPRTRAEAFGALLGRLGFRAVPFSKACMDAADDAETRALARSLGIAAFGAMNVMLVSVAVWVGTDMGEATRGLMHWLSALIGLPVIAVAGLPFYRSALAALRNGRANMDVAVSLAIIATAVMSLSEALRNGPYTWFDGATALLALLLAGRLLDRRARGRAGQAVAELLALQHGSVRVLDAAGIPRETPVEQVPAGATLLLAAGERLRLDAVVDGAPALFDLAATTGESLPRHLPAGSAVPAGAVNMGAPVRLCVTAAASDGSLAAMARLLETAGQARSRFTSVADRAARLYVPIVHLVAAATFIGWWVSGVGWQAALVPAVAALIITCPCGLAIAVPAVQVVAVGALFRRGVLVASPHALERLADVTHVVLDKTGTLTEGAPRLLPGAHDAATLRRAASLAQASRHPLARALVAACPEAPAAQDAQEVAGQGVRSGEARLGSARFAGAPSGAEEGMALWFSEPGRAPVRFAFADRLRDDARASVAALHGLGLSVEILSGDAAPAVAEMAAAVGVTRFAAGLQPADKLARIQALQAGGARVLMVGDGINDAPALAAAHASASPENGTDLAQTCADLVLRAGGLAQLAPAIRTARRARRLALQNISGSLAYNVVAVPLAITGLVTPLIAALVMASSSLAVIGNALRAGRDA